MENLEKPFTGTDSLVGMIASLSKNVNVELFLNFIVAALLLSVIAIVIMIVNRNMLKKYKKEIIIGLIFLSSGESLFSYFLNNWHASYIFSIITNLLFWFKLLYIQKK